jgi:hypothetical protein
VASLVCTSGRSRGPAVAKNGIQTIADMPICSWMSLETHTLPAVAFMCISGKWALWLIRSFLARPCWWKGMGVFGYKAFCSGSRICSLFTYYGFTVAPILGDNILFICLIEFHCLPIPISSSVYKEFFLPHSRQKWLLNSPSSRASCFPPVPHQQQPPHRQAQARYQVR